jgi:MFS family permease
MVAATEVSAWRAWSVTGLCASFMSINYADKVIVGLAAVPIMEDLHLSPSQFGLLGSAFFLLYSLSAIGVSFIADRVASKWIIAALSLVWALTLIPMSFEVGFATLLVSRIVLGAAEGPSIAIANHCIFKWFPNAERSLPSSVVSIGSSIGVLFSAPALAWLIKTYDWHVAFAVLAAVGLAWLPIWLLAAKEGPLSAAPIAGGEPERADVQALPLMRLLTQRTFLGVLACAYVAFSVLALVVAWLPPFLIKSEHYSPTAASWIVAAAWTIEAIAVVVVGWYSGKLAARGVSSRMSRGWITTGAVCLTGVALAAMQFLPIGVIRVGVLVIAFSAAQTIWPLCFTLISEIVPNVRRGMAVSVFTAIFTTAGLVSPALMGYAVQWGDTASGDGYITGFVILGIATLVGGLIGFWLIDPEADQVRANGRAFAAVAAS